MACELIAQELEEARGLARDLFSQWHAATGKKKSRLFFLWRAANTTVARLRVEYENCLNPPALLPDLVPVGVSRSRSVPITEPAFDAAVVINNQGAASAVGPFTGTFGLDYADYNQDPPLRVYRGVALEPSCQSYRRNNKEDNYTRSRL